MSDGGWDRRPRATGRWPQAVGRALAALFTLSLVAGSLSAQPARRPPLNATDIGDIARLLMFEDTRTFDSTALTTLLRSTHPEIRRRAALSVGRIADPAGRALLRAARADADTAVAATVVFSTAQLYDTASLGWLDSLLKNRTTPVTVATEAARALGMIRTPEARTMLSAYLSSAPGDARSAPIVGEALLSIGRHPRGDLAPIERWTVSRNVEVRWRAAWALFRPRNPAAVQHLLRLTGDSAPIVRNWAVRGLVWSQVDTSGLEPIRVRQRLSSMVIGDADRTVRTEALRALGTHPDSASVAFVANALASTDSWMSVSAAEGLGTQRDYAAVSVSALVAATSATRSCALRSTALAALNTVAPDSGFEAATQMSRDTSILCRTSAITFFRNKGERAREVLGALREDSVAAVSTAARTAYDALSDTTTGRGGRGGGGGGGGRGGGRGRPIQTTRTEADYRAIVERWVVPEYRGAPRPRSEWTTARGAFTIELYPGDAPIATDDFVRNVNSGAIVNVPFPRLVPDFVAQQAPVTGAVVVRDEVNRYRLTRANVSWASAGLDTGRPGYTLGHTAQPHNEGGFTALGRIIRGMDVVDRLEAGDRVLSTRMLPAVR